MIQKRDQAFHSHHPKHFKTSSQKSGGTSLLINGSPNSDPSCVLPLWADHFSNLSTSCFYDLASAFDTVEYPVLFSHLKKAGVSGKAWRLIKDWYTNVSSSVRVGRQEVSPSFSVSRGVRQGSVLSPTLFLLVMDPILLELSKRSCGPSICGLYLGAFSHADDICYRTGRLRTCQRAWR